jgi:putative ABC transport system permease protein
VRIVGVVNTATLRTIGEPPQPIIYFPMRQHPTARVAVYAQARTNAAVTAADVAEAVKAYDAALQPLRTRVGEEIVSDLFAARRLGVRLLVVFGSLALVLTAIGTYSVVSYAVAQRTREIAIRLALGATPSRVVGMIVEEGAAIAATGLALGVAIAVAGTGGIMTLTFGVDRLDAVSLAGSATVLLAAVFLASLIAAGRGAASEPMGALRSPF